MIGSSLKYLSESRWGYIFAELLGTPDLHTHIRLKPVLSYLTNSILKSLDPKILEVGCGYGVIPYELLDRGFNFFYTGFDQDEDSIVKANKVIKNYNYAKLNFIKMNSFSGSWETGGEKYDIVLLIDVIEHITDPEKLIRKIIEYTNKKSLFLVSVPTINYPKVFGKRFHRKVGHVINGYTLRSLEDLMNKINCKLKYYKFNTGLLSNIGCFLYYRISFNKRMLERIKIMLLYIFKYLDLVNNKKFSCSLFAVFEVG